ncbi:heme-dependent catalase [Sarocladium strictum]
MTSNAKTASNPISTLANGQPSENPGSVQQIRYGQSNGGLIVLSDTQTVEILAHFARERIPERSVHAKAAGVFGEFELLEDVSDLTDAALLTGVGKKTPILTRISTVGGEKGSADTVRDVRGWATKFYTEEGIQDFVFNDLPVFFIRDPIKFPSMNRSHKRHPRTNIPENNMFWDFHINNPEGIHALMHLFGQRGIPESVRHINGFSVHTYTLNKSDGSYVYVKWHFKPEGGVKTMDPERAARLAGTDPDYHPFEKYPLRRVGRLTLNKNPNNYFQDIEQACFSPSYMVPGIGASADPVLQARIFSYPDAHRYRVYAPYVRDGPSTSNGNYGSDPDYVFSQLRPVALSSRVSVPTHEIYDGQVTAYATQFDEDKDYVQARQLRKIISAEGREKGFIGNVLGTFKGLGPQLRTRVIEYLGRVDAGIKTSLQQGSTA